MIAEPGEKFVGLALEERIDPRVRSRMEVHRSGDLLYMEAELPGVFRTLFTTRLGGVSQGSFARLNLDTRSFDDPDAVEHNRSLVMRVLEEISALPGEGDARSPYRFVNPAQAHGVRVVGAAEYVLDHAGTPCDGLTLNPMLDEGLAAVLLFADCVPVVLVSEVDMAVVHGGWRGILGGVVQEAGRSMTGPPGAAVIGPSIGPCCYTVGEDLARGFGARFGPEVVVGPDAATYEATSSGAATPGAGTLQTPEGTYRVDLWGAVVKALTEIGVGRDQIVNPRLCTACNSDLFYSYRREGPVTGRHGCIGWAVAT